MQTSKFGYRKLLSSIAIGLLMGQVFMIGMPYGWLGPASGGSETWWNASWLYRKAITIDHTMVDADLSNFPVLINMTDGDLASKAQDDGDDIVFTDDDGVKLDHEIELYDNDTGYLVAWVCANLSSTVDTTLYMYYGNGAAANQENVEAVWDSNYMMVQHLTGASYYALDDSTSNNNDVAGEGATPAYNATAKIAKGVDFERDNADYLYVNDSDTLDGFSSAAWGLWFNAESIPADGSNEWHTLLNKYNIAGNQRSWSIALWGGSASEQCQLRINLSPDGVNYIGNYYNWKPNLGEWYNTVITWTSGSAPMLYINGVQTAWTSSESVTGTLLASTQRLDIGNSYATARTWDGLLDEIRISNGARSAAWIDTCYSNQDDPSEFYNVGSEETVPEAPIVTIPTPSEGATSVSVALSELSFNLTDLQSDQMNYTVTTSPNIGSDSATNVNDGRYTVSVSGLTHKTTYTWHVNVTDGAHWNNKTYSFTTETEWWNISWQYRKAITTDHTKVDADLSNFPVLINVSDNSIKSNAQDNGDDIVFTDDNGVKLNHEIELYDNDTGHLVAWVNANLSSTVDSVFYMYYGNVAAANQENVEAVWDSNYMMVQHLEETSGTHYDSTVYDNDGAASGVVQDAAGQIDGADDFDGTDDYVQIPHNNTLTGYTEAMTASVWVKFDNVSTRRTMLNKYNTTNNERGWALDWGQDNSFGFIASPTGVTGNYESWFTPYSPTQGEWYHVVAVWQSNQNATFYVNGVQLSGVGTQHRTVASIYNNTAEPLYIGRAYSAAAPGGRHLDGIIDEARVSDVARSESWIVTCYNNQHDASSFYTVGSEQTAPANQPPTHANPILVSSLGTNRTNEDLTCYNQSTSDPDGDPATNIYHWYKDDVSLTNLLMPFDTNTTARDYSGYGNNGTISGATWTSNGVVGGAYSFDGSDDYIVISDASSLDGDGSWTEMTVEHWFYLSSDQTGGKTIAKMSTIGEAKRSYQIGFQSSTPANRLYGAVIVGSNTYREAAYNTPLSSGIWYHVALTYKSGTGVKLYLNGVQVASISGTGNVQASPDKDLYIGCRYGTEGFFEGKIDELRLYPQALTVEQIYQHYLESKDGFSSNSTVVSEETSVGDVWKCEVTPSDGAQDGTAKTSNTLTIVSAPQPYDDIIFDSSFDMGNLINVQFQEGDASGYRYYTAEVNYSTASFPDKHWWFYFSMANTTGKTIKIEMQDLAYEDFTELRWTSCEPVYSYDDANWIRVPDGNYSCGTSTTKNFTITLSPSEDKVWLAPIPPYTVTMRDNLFDSYLSSSYLKVTSLGITPLGQNLTVATITDPSYADDGKFKVYIIAQQHACETPSSFVGEGMIRFLLNETDATAAAIRRSYIFKIVPIVNVEGVYYGISRYTPFRSGAQYDLNRAWDDVPISTVTVPEVNWTFIDIQSWMPDAFLDLHTDVQSLDCFFLHDGLYDSVMVNFLNNVSRGRDGTKDYWPETGGRGSCISSGAAPNVRTRIGVHPSTLMEHPHDDRTNTTAHPTDHNPQTVADWKDWGKRAVLGMYEYFGEAGNPNLIVESIVIVDQGCQIYANDTYANGTAYYVPVKVTIKNTGNYSAGQFNVSLEIYWTTGTQQESLVELTVPSLDAGENATLTFYWRPTHTRYYNLTAMVDCDNEVDEDNEGDNSLSESNVPITVTGDINGDGVVNIFDAVVISLAWDSDSGSGHWNLCADINHDGHVDILDGVRIGLHWGKTW